MPELPTGTVTLVFTDIEGSTKLLDELGEHYADVLAEHRRVLREAFGGHGGVEVDTQGDAFFYVFAKAADAVSAAGVAQRGLLGGPVAVRMGVHTGEPTVTEEGYVGADVHRAARIMGAGHGGQVLLSQTTHDLLDSGAELRDLGEHRLKDIEGPVWIFQLGSEAFPPLKTISNTNLPRPASSFVGRGRELDELLALLREESVRLLTLTGPGGSGKTRLAIEAAGELVGEYPSGVFWVGLAALRDPALVTETIAQTLGAKDGLAAHIGERELLLLIDNLEQVVEAAPELSALLERCPKLALLVTSRELLRVQGEVEYEVPPLAEPEAIELFCERARIEPSNEVEELCVRLDNLPLAVELAAARVKVLSPAQILERLSQRLDLLKGGRGADPRQQTLRATIEWSFQLLSKQEERLFRRLAVFAGGCTLEAAEQVAEADVDTLQSLVDKSLLRHSDERFWMLETIREYAAERHGESGEAEVVKAKHAEYYLVLAEEACPHLRVGGDQPYWRARLRPEHDNVRSALVILGEREDDRELRLAASFWWFWWADGLLTEGRQWLGHALRSSVADSELRANALEGASYLAYRQGDFSEARRFSEERLQLYRDMRDEPGIGSVLLNLGNIEAAEGRVDEAGQLFRESLERLGDDPDARYALGGLGVLAYEAGQWREARRFFERSIDLARRIDDQRGVINNLGGVAFTFIDEGDETAAADYLRQVMRLARTLNDIEGLVRFGFIGTAAATARSQPEEAAQLLGAAVAVLDRLATPLSSPLCRLRDRTLADAERLVGSERTAQAQAEGSSLTLDDAVEKAIRLLD